MRSNQTQTEARTLRGLEEGHTRRTPLFAGFFAFDEPSKLSFRFRVTVVFAVFIVFLDHIKNSLNGSTARGGFVVSKLRGQLVQETCSHKVNYTSVAAGHWRVPPKAETEKICL